MKITCCREVFLIALSAISFSACAGTVAGVSTYRVTELDLIRSGANVVYVTSPGNESYGDTRQHQNISLVVPHEYQESFADLSCTLKNDKGMWTITAGDTARVLRSSRPLAVSCEQHGTLVASGTLEATPTEITLPAGPFFDEHTATVPAYAPSLSLAPVPVDTTAATDIAP